VVAQYRTLSGINYPPDNRAEPGDVVSDLPIKSIPWLLEQGHIVKADESGGEIK
jgi:hypothetical protein